MKILFQMLRSFNLPPIKNIIIRAMSSGPYNYINGKRCAPSQALKEISVHNPSTGELYCSLPCSDYEEVDKAVKSSSDAFKTWSEFSSHVRGHYLNKVASLIRNKLEELANLESIDTGKPIWESRVDIAGCADAFEYFGGIVPTLSGEHYSLGNQDFGFVRREPLGVVVGIGAWNYPFQVISWKAAPSLAAGNTMVFKPSEFTPLTAINLAEIFNEAGVPPGVLNITQGDGETGKLLCSHPAVAKVSFTGSVNTGQKIMKLCADDMKKCTLEMGGKSALIVFEDSDLVEAVKATLIGNFLSQGEVCTNCTRVYVQQKVYDSFLKQLIDATSKLTIGDPFHDDTQVGATISTQHAQNVLDHIAQAQTQGAQIACGGERILLKDSKLQGGYYLSPCILTHCTEEMKIVKEEIFGSVVCIMPFESELEVIERANSSKYGLAGGVMTNDLKRAHRVANQLKAGIVWINNYNVFPLELPFGGYKLSGIGRENGKAALFEYTQMKSVYVGMNSIDCPLYKN